MSLLGIKIGEGISNATDPTRIQQREATQLKLEREMQAAQYAMSSGVDKDKIDAEAEQARLQEAQAGRAIYAVSQQYIAEAMRAFMATGNVNAFRDAVANDSSRFGDNAVSNNMPWIETMKVLSLDNDNAEDYQKAKEALKTSILEQIGEIPAEEFLKADGTTMNAQEKADKTNKIVEEFMKEEGQLFGAYLDGDGHMDYFTAKSVFTSMLGYTQQQYDMISDPRFGNIQTPKNEDIQLQELKHKQAIEMFEIEHGGELNLMRVEALYTKSRDELKQKHAQELLEAKTDADREALKEKHAHETRENEKKWATYLEIARIRANATSSRPLKPREKADNQAAIFDGALLNALNSGNIEEVQRVFKDPQYANFRDKADDDATQSYLFNKIRTAISNADWEGVEGQERFKAIRPELIEQTKKYWSNKINEETQGLFNANIEEIAESIYSQGELTGDLLNYFTGINEGTGKFAARVEEVFGLKNIKSMKTLLKSLKEIETDTLVARIATFIAGKAITRPEIELVLNPQVGQDKGETISLLISTIMSSNISNNMLDEGLIISTLSTRMANLVDHITTNAVERNKDYHRLLAGNTLKGTSASIWNPTELWNFQQGEENISKNEKQKDKRQVARAFMSLTPELNRPEAIYNHFASNNVFQDESMVILESNLVASHDRQNIYREGAREIFEKIFKPEINNYLTQDRKILYGQTDYTLDLFNRDLKILEQGFSFQNNEQDAAIQRILSLWHNLSIERRNKGTQGQTAPIKAGEQTTTNAAGSLDQLKKRIELQGIE